MIHLKPEHNISYEYVLQLTEFGCVDASFEDGQRDFRQVDALYSARYRQEFVGGVVFEYSTESINSLAPYPFKEYGEGNFGLGYFQPESCDDIETPCQFTPFPQFSILSNKYAEVDTSSEPILSDLPIEHLYHVCPAQFPLLGSYEWASSSMPDRECPGKVYVTCPGVPNECTGLGVPFQTTPPTSAAPQVSLETRQGSKTPTLSPEAVNHTEAAMPTEGASTTTSPVLAAATMAPTAAPSDTPTLSLGVNLLSSQNPTGSGSSPTASPIALATQAPMNIGELISSPSPIANSEGEMTGGTDDRNEESSAILSCSSVSRVCWLLLLSLMFRQ